MNLLDTAPGFDQPIAVLKHCHDRIRKQLATLQKLLAHLPRYGADPEAQQAALAVLKYFDKAAPLHHDDEEQDLMPMLQATAQGEDQAALEQHGPQILADHRQMEALWQRLHAQLTAVASGASANLSPVDVNEFAGLYGRHMLVEETHIAPMAKRLFSATQMADLGHAMQVRRGIVPAGERVAAMRKDYERAQLSETDVDADPVKQFETWFEEALKAAVDEPNAMALSTVDADGRPSSRIVLVKQFDARGFTWYTNYDSQKGQQLCANPHAALLFFWRELERQVRIEGKVERTSAEESDTYFASRPLNSRLSAIASQQSRPIASRSDLERHYEEAAAQYGEQPPRPAHWGGYRLVPERVEFWQGRTSRFHDRIVYTRQPDGSWTRQRLQP
ncbi:pyridoxamine 5'-phosphate oxidase [Massilia arenosa]|uniref:Pyridoxine/pyridoxamine 5'-phosphate oxidase n=1 Tax=Zemynaea arenosa TaxID=2561931 RepID=A0A4Y9SP62_9BURK|nr:pyridoxamine 5'-phosphate oxidase [Massilia arenosa]TFW25463.1 pyridoxamine 5'-phosphate oxidase [Massilia arenosa]